jgi:hypothetical protein
MVCDVYPEKTITRLALLMPRHFHPLHAFAYCWPDSHFNCCPFEERNLAQSKSMAIPPANSGTCNAINGLLGRLFNLTLYFAKL